MCPPADDTIPTAAVGDTEVEQQTSANRIQQYNIQLAGKTFTISSHRDDPHIRKVEQLVGRTYDQVSEKLQQVPAIHTALLTALNIADQLVDLQARLQDSNKQEKLSQMTQQLNSALRLPESEDSPAADKF